jgi:competence protein ComEC
LCFQIFSFALDTAEPHRILPQHFVLFGCYREGDGEKAVERTVATEGLRAQLLKVAHNGSLTSTTPELLGAVQPSFAFISVRARNRCGYPRIETLARSEQSGLKTYGTDLDGVVSFYPDDGGVTPRVHH